MDSMRMQDMDQRIPVTPPSETFVSTVHLAIHPRRTSQISTVSPAKPAFLSPSTDSDTGATAERKLGVAFCIRGLAKSSAPLPPLNSAFETSATSQGYSGRQRTRLTGYEGCSIYVGLFTICDAVLDPGRSQTFSHSCTRFQQDIKATYLDCVIEATTDYPTPLHLRRDAIRTLVRDPGGAPIQS